ncbi:MAG: cell wall hydrolase [Lachnospiraceae bacterium]|nr:cell wall hydrolase [Lachnospiraceae bacterium]
MRYKRLILLLVSLAMAFSSTNPHRASAAVVEEAVVEEKELVDELSALEVVTREVERQRELEEAEDLSLVSAENAQLVQQALADAETRKTEELAIKMRADAQAKTSAVSTMKKSHRLHLSQEDIEILYQIVQAEAGNQSLKGRIMIVNVIMNRVKCSYFPDTVGGVVFQKYQFSPVLTGGYYKAVPDATTKRAVQAAINGEDYSDGALYFCMHYLARQFSRHLTYVTEEGDHVFFK